MKPQDLDRIKLRLQRLGHGEHCWIDRWALVIAVEQARTQNLLAAVIAAPLDEVAMERHRQDEQWGEQNHPDGTGGHDYEAQADMARDWCRDKASDGSVTWADILHEEVAEALAESDPDKLRSELIQVAAVATCWAEAIDRREARADAESTGESSESARPAGEDVSSCPPAPAGSQTAGEDPNGNGGSSPATRGEGFRKAWRSVRSERNAQQRRRRGRRTPPGVDGAAGYRRRSS